MPAPLTCWLTAFHSWIALLPVSAKYTLPCPSTATPVGLFSPEDTSTVTARRRHPLLDALLPLSAKYTLPCRPPPHRWDCSIPSQPTWSPAGSPHSIRRWRCCWYRKSRRCPARPPPLRTGCSNPRPSGQLLTAGALNSSMAWLPLSAIYTFPCPSTATALGLFCAEESTTVCCVRGHSTP
jgi:hypothetical protein